jgi:hypothetical protein
MLGYGSTLTPEINGGGVVRRVGRGDLLGIRMSGENLAGKRSAGCIGMIAAPQWPPTAVSQALISILKSNY